MNYSTSFLKVHFYSKPYILKFLYYTYGNPINFNGNDDLGRFVFGLLEKNASVENKLYLGEKKDLKNDSFFLIPFSWGKSFKLGLSENQIKLLNRELLNIFEFHLYLFFIHTTLPNMRYMNKNITLELFAKKYNILIDEDISWDAFIKMEYRLRKKYELEFD